jgi:glycosyltransferase
MKFAYLIMAHDNPNQLKILLELLDYGINDIYLHIDPKSRELKNVNWLGCVKYAKIYTYSKYNVLWGDISQTKCQMFLLKEALRFHHDYYHLISGKDLPIKPHTEIINFFEKNKGKEFVFFEDSDYCKKDSCLHYHFFYYVENEKNKILRNFKFLLDNFLLWIQKALKVERKFYCGDNWFSITEKLASDFSSKGKKMIRKVKFCKNSDELILQTFLYPIYKDYDLYYRGFDSNHISILRYIDWDRGSPYVWRLKDYDQLCESPFLFARKFDETIDNKIILKIYNKLKN